ncbi:hypothetical protein WOLCODRAFT_162563 [Wolfiporia cocos MD-104 SS10]|uniref:Uncharacterized protein n=1 Tax=Wolfiporia cocos (strain MD-104) TaxID=742152 RepID=A0A2H3JF10_WOLCO|nr:hypothetical protein WOLCODRAFT_162563 [Wolfiporia cocos MD-104 SS10]
MPIFSRRSSSRSSSKSRGSAAPSRAPSPPREPQVGSKVLQQSSRVAALDNLAAGTSSDSKKGAGDVPSTADSPATDFPSENSAPDHLFVSPANSCQSLSFVKLDAIVEQSHSDLQARLQQNQEVGQAGPSGAVDVIAAPAEQNSGPTFSGFAVPTSVENRAHLSIDTANEANQTLLVTLTAPSPDVPASVLDGMQCGKTISTERSSQAEKAVGTVTVSTEAIKQVINATQISGDHTSSAEAQPTAHELSFTSFGSSYPHSLHRVYSGVIDSSPALQDADESIAPLPVPRDLSSNEAAVVRLPSNTVTIPIAQTPLRRSNPTPPPTKSLHVGERTIEPLGIPLPTTYAGATNVSPLLGTSLRVHLLTAFGFQLALQFPQLAEQILKLPLTGPESSSNSDSSSSDSASVSTSSRPPSKPNSAATSISSASDGEWFQDQVGLKGPAHTEDRPNWALAPETPKRESRPRGRGRGRGQTRGRGRHGSRARSEDSSTAGRSVPTTPVTKKANMIEKSAQSTLYSLPSGPNTEAQVTVDIRAQAPALISHAQASTAGSSVDCEKHDHNPGTLFSAAVAIKQASSVTHNGDSVPSNVVIGTDVKNAAGPVKDTLPSLAELAKHVRLRKRDSFSPQRASSRIPSKQDLRSDFVASSLQSSSARTPNSSPERHPVSMSADSLMSIMERRAKLVASLQGPIRMAIPSDVEIGGLSQNTMSASPHEVGAPAVSIRACVIDGRTERPPPFAASEQTRTDSLMSTSLPRISAAVTVPSAASDNQYMDPPKAWKVDDNGILRRSLSGLSFQAPHVETACRSQMASSPARANWRDLNRGTKNTPYLGSTRALDQHETSSRRWPPISDGYGRKQSVVLDKKPRPGQQI